ncbi:hypothetical protein PoB_001661500 [Plakobranchus ocellatus]|uniref:EGF-like domain-containing protein n=1 Tax=Plakobranchus ocellatus TaxID=259542 RepID=A0AAV3Z3V2_9GAST|nr:hypothetical protein PoB_001661500 [Plakobranchus ocellatus]
MAAAKVVLLALQFITVQGLQKTTYIKKDVCNLRDRINNNCFILQTEETKIGCAFACRAKPACEEFVFSSEDSSCYHQSPCSYAPSCSAFDADLIFFTSEGQTITNQLEETTAPQGTTTVLSETTEPDQTTSAAQVCQNGGMFTGSVCDCSGTGGKVGQYCESDATSCSDLVGFGYTNGEYRVKLDINGDGSDVFQAYCVLQTSEVQLHLVRSSGLHFTGYPLGNFIIAFHFGPKDFWLGLDRMIALTSTARTLKFRVIYNSTDCQGSASVKYTNVTFSYTSSNVYIERQPTISSSSGFSFQPRPENHTDFVPNSKVIDFSNFPSFAAPGTGGGR